MKEKVMNVPKRKNKRVNMESLWSINDERDPLSLESCFKLYYDRKKCKKEPIYLYTPKDDVIGFEEVSLFNKFLHSIPTTKEGINILPLFVNLDGLKFKDKLVYIIFETIIYYLVIDKNWNISIIGNVKSENCSNGVKYSSLSSFNLPISVVSENNYLNYFSQRRDARGLKYKFNRVENKDLSLTRCLAYSSSYGDDKGNISSDIYEFLSNSKALCDIDPKMKNQIADIIIEIKDNCFEHTELSYVYDIDVKKVTHESCSDLKGQDYIAINVAIWDFSGVRLGDAIKRKTNLIESPTTTIEERLYALGDKTKTFEKLFQAKEQHSSFFDEKYDEDDMFSLLAFQPGVTGRPKPRSTEGTGLSSVLDFLCNFPDNYRCYCLSGDTIINLDKKYLKRDKVGWYSFCENTTPDFINNKPSCSCVSKSSFFYPGTAYFLHLEINGGIDL